LNRVELWFKKGTAGSWVYSGLNQAGASGTYTFAGMTGIDTYFFDLCAVDGAGKPLGSGGRRRDCQTAYTTSLAPNLLLPRNGASWSRSRRSTTPTRGRRAG